MQDNYSEKLSDSYYLIGSQSINHYISRNQLISSYSSNRAGTKSLQIYFEIAFDINIQALLILINFLKQILQYKN